MHELVIDIIFHLLLFALGFAFIISHTQIHNRLDRALQKLQSLLGERWTRRLRTGWAWIAVLILIVGGITILLGGLGFLIMDLVEVWREKAGL